MATKNKDDFVLLKDENVKNMFTNPNTGKRFSASVIANTLGIPEEDVYNNLEYMHPKLGINQNVVSNETDTIYEVNGCIINIEFNHSYIGRSTKVKNEAYICSLYLRQLPNSEYYNKLKPIIQINLDGSDYFKAGKFIYKSMLMETNLHIVDTENIQIYHINLSYLRDLGYNNIKKEANKLEKLLYILVCEDKNNLDKLYADDELMKEVRKEMERNIEAIDQFLYYNREELDRLDHEEAMKKGYQDGMEKGMEKGIEKGIEKGLSQGISQSKIEIAKSLLKSGMNIEDVSFHTNLSVEEIESLK